MGEIREGQEEIYVTALAVLQIENVSWNSPLRIQLCIFIPDVGLEFASTVQVFVDSYINCVPQSSNDTEVVLTVFRLILCLKRTCFAEPRATCE